MQIGKLTLTDRLYESTPVALTNYHSVEALRYEEFHTRLLLFGPKGRGFWSPFCEVQLINRLSDGRLIGVCSAMEFKAVTFLEIMNVVVADYDRREMAKALDFMPFEIKSGHTYRFQYQFLLRGRQHDLRRM